jgi:hypothetical protein
MGWDSFLECSSRTLAGSSLFINQRVLDEYADLPSGGWVQLKKI